LKKKWRLAQEPLAEELHASIDCLPDNLTEKEAVLPNRFKNLGSALFSFGGG